MEYPIKVIEDCSEIKLCPLFQVDKYNWGGDYRPETFGALGFIPHTGFYLKMTCMEQEPVRVYTQPNDPVYFDSAMEAFFQFYPDEMPETYLNFEANANGALHAKYGNGRWVRNVFPPDLHNACRCKGTVHDGFWTMELTVPFSLIEFVYGHSDFVSGDRLTCNFYKIKESEGLTHFGSYTAIENEEPNFHLPQFFADAIIE